MTTISQLTDHANMPTMVPDLVAVAWPPERLAEALEALARQVGLVQRTREAEVFVPTGADRERWLDAVAARLGVEVEPVTADFNGLLELVRGSAPALLRLHAHEAGQELILALVKCGSKAQLLGPDGQMLRVTPAQLAAALGAGKEAPLVAQVDRLLARAGVIEARRAVAGRTLVREQLAGESFAVGWLLRQPLSASMFDYARHLQILRPLMLVGMLTLAVQLLTILTWALLGREALSGVFTWARVSAWGLLLLSAIPAQIWLVFAQSKLELLLSASIKLRLLAGAFALNPDEVRHQGIGSFLGLVIDAETFDDLLGLGTLAALNAFSQLATAALVLLYGAAALTHLGLLALWVLIVVGLLLLMIYQTWVWFAVHRDMTNNLVETMVGHRTRLVQEDRTRWHEREDRALARYLRASSQLDWTSSLIAALPRTWTIVALTALAPFILSGAEPTALAISLGGIILARQGFNLFATSSSNIATSVTAWRQINPFLQMGLRLRGNAPALVASSQTSQAGQPLLTARGLVYRYRPGAEPALRGCNLRIAVGDRVLLEGSSGGGKSTFAAVLAGLRQPEAGLLLLDNLDYPSLGAAGWRRRVAMAPQFHENHVFTATFGFNLLMGRRWPATPEELEEAEVLCRELGLGDLLDRMPAGMMQQVGETGWQLSHGEKSRLFLARALLQGAELIILDESFGALDPETLELALACALRRAPAMVLIAHP